MFSFSSALQELDERGASTSTPESFVDYCHRTKQKKPSDVPSIISVQTLSDLNRDLLDANVMVFRLGSPPGSRTTHFGLSRIVNDWSDYFLIDSQLFDDAETRAFIPSSSYRDLYAFSLFPKFTETTLVNLALASGLMAEALGLDRTPSIPVTGRSTYTFKFRPRLPNDVTWSHHNGQVEVDSVFTAHRNGRDCLFIVEAKHGKEDSLAKTKLLYPFLSLRPHVPVDMPISLVYLRATTTGNKIAYNLAECVPPSHDTPSPLDLVVSSARRYTMTAF